MIIYKIINTKYDTHIYNLKNVYFKNFMNFFGKFIYKLCIKIRKRKHKKDRILTGTDIFYKKYIIKRKSLFKNDFF